MNAPTRPYRALRAAVGAVILAAVLALWAYGHLVGPPLGAMWDVAVLALVLASGYAVFGEATMTGAIDDATDLADGGDTDDTGGEE